MSNLNRRILGVALRDIFSVTLDGRFHNQHDLALSTPCDFRILTDLDPPTSEKNRPAVAQGSTVRLTLDLQRICGVCEIRPSDSVPPDA